MVNIERRPHVLGDSSIPSDLEDKYLEERPYTSGEAPGIALHVQNSLRK